MRPFRYLTADSVAVATRAARDEGTMFFAGGTTLSDLMKLNVLTPESIVDTTSLPLDRIELDGGVIRVGANVRNSDLAWHPAVRERCPVLSEALLAGASAQIRNMATTAGNIRQRTRCPYFRDVHAACNKRQPGAGCDAIDGLNRGHAVLGTSDRCIAMFPSDMCTALAILNALVRTEQPDGGVRGIPFNDFHLLPGDTPERETVLEPGEMITHVDLLELPIARRSSYLKVRDRASYEFALASAAVAVEIDDGTLREARVGLGGIATKPWRSHAAEDALRGREPTQEVFRAAADAALADAAPRKHNAFKIELAKRTLVRALTELTARQAS
jgi:xanthine dehydrogenase YagS FAD-binding subunit